ncbi:hypothetical protein [Miniphocaeibacter massiliensis]|uniref:hypothetical protein n=1 Tax=Miniphocaeibacter massiliensis TaxID=2041841 RepID=UPI000C1C2210|nr:hypothetical protein [Miniphocaeibacter massiliensis]
MDKIEFKGKSNMDFRNLYVSDIGEKVKPQEEVIIYDNIPGRSDTPIERTGKYNGYTRTITLYDKDGNVNFDDWLTGEGNLKISREPGGFYKASVYDDYKIVQVRGLNTRYIEVPFKIQPFFRLDVGENAIVLEENSLTLYNEYSIPAKPLIKLKGEGNLSFWIGNNYIQVYDVIDHAFIDSELGVCYSEYDKKEKKIEGLFPVLKKGENTIKRINCNIEIKPRWCRLW